MAVDDPRVPARQDFLDDERRAQTVGARLLPRPDPDAGEARDGRGDVGGGGDQSDVGGKRRLVTTVARGRGGRDGEAQQRAGDGGSEETSRHGTGLIIRRGARESTTSPGPTIL